MSRKRRRRPVEKPNNTAITTVQDRTMSAMDGYINSLAYLGEASPLNRANDYERHSISNDFNTLTVLYRENWLAARIIDTPSEDMTRAWYSLSSEIDQERLDELAKLEARHNVKQEITDAIRWARLYGGAAAVMVIAGQEDMLEEPLDYDMLQPGCFRGLIVVDRVRGIFPSLELEENMDDPEYGYPMWYEVTLNEESGDILRIHHSRMLIFKGRRLPIDEEINADYWGASEMEHIYEELQKRNSSSANIAQLIFQANVAAIKLSDYGEVLGMGSQQQRAAMFKAIQEMNRIRTSYGITLLGREDDYEQHPYSFAGVAEVYETFMMDMAGAAEIPATKLFGRAPQGMNSTGESDMKNYYDMIGQLQERDLKPALEKLLPVMSMSLWGEVPEDLEIVFEPLGSTTPAERAEIMGQFANPIIQAFSAGLISQKVALSELRETGKPINAWTNITDGDIENADEEVDQGEEMQDPMGMMGPGMNEPGGMPEMPQEPEIDPAKAAELKERVHSLREEQEQPEVDENKVAELKQRIKGVRQEQAREEEPEIDSEKVEKLKSRVQSIREKAGQGNDRPEPSQAERIENLKARIEKLKEKGVEDGGPGSGPRPGYHKKASIGERLKFMANPAASIPQSPNPQRTPESVKKANSEREEWGDLTLHQKVAGNSAQERHMRKVKRKVMQAAARGDIRKAKEVMMRNKHYFQNDPESAMKVQSEALQRQKKVRRGPLHDVLSFFRKPMEDGGPGSGNFGHAGRPGKKGGSAPRGAGSSATSGTPQSGTTGNVKIPEGETFDPGKIAEILENQKKWEPFKEQEKPHEIVFHNNEPETEIGGNNDYTQSRMWSDQRLKKLGIRYNWKTGNFYGSPEAMNSSEGKKEMEARIRLEKSIKEKEDKKTEENKSFPENWKPDFSVKPSYSETEQNEPIDNSSQAAYNGHATKGWKGLKATMEVGGPKAARDYFRKYFQENPDVAQQATKYMDVRKKVANFLTDHPEAENFNTYDYKTGKVKPIESGFCVTFHQNNSADDPLGGYTDQDYANLCAIAAHELGTDEVNIGYYGNPEVSFVCQDEAAAKSFAVRHNQQSVYNANTGRTLKNKEWRKDLNPIRL